MSLRIFALPLIVAVSLGVAACGDDDDSGGSETATTDFTAEADAVCVDAAREIADLALAREQAPADEEAVVAAYEEIVPVLEPALADFEAIEPPADASADYEEFISLRQEGIDLRLEAIDASEQGDSKGYEAAVGKLGPTFEESEKVAERIGFEACANVLPEDDVEAVETVETETAASDDPSVLCEDFYLPQALQQFYGSTDPEKCLKDPKSAKPVEIVVNEVTGTDGVVAFATVEFPEEPKAGRGPFEDTLYYVDGEWRLYSFANAE